MARRRPELNTPAWARARAEALERDEWRCRECGKAGYLEVHHIKRVRFGGAPFDLRNLKTLCRRCHQEVTNEERGLVRRDWDDLVDQLLFENEGD